MSAQVVAALAAVAAVLVGTAPAALRTPAATSAQAPDGPTVAGPTRLRVVRLLLAAGVGSGGAVLVGGAAGVVAGATSGAAAWWFLGRVEPPHVTRQREEARDDLPHLVGLFAATLRAGQDPVAGLEAACRALPGAAADQLAVVLARARLGERGPAWADLAQDPVLGRLGRTLGRAHDTGAPVTSAVERLADELQSDLATAAEDRARRVGVLAALPLGVCLLPAFMLLGIVPTVAAMLGGLTR